MTEGILDALVLVVFVTTETDGLAILLPFVGRVRDGIEDLLKFKFIFLRKVIMFIVYIKYAKTYFESKSLA